MGILGSIPGRGRDFLFCAASKKTVGSTQPPLQFVPGFSSERVKWPRRETDHSPPSSAEIKTLKYQIAFAGIHGLISYNIELFK
jgi:hypothetical protein